MDMDNEKTSCFSEKEHECKGDEQHSNADGCGCGCGCGCGDSSGDVSKDVQVNQYVTLIQPDSSELECQVLGIFQNCSFNYVALLHPIEETVLIFRFFLNPDRSMDLVEIENDEEYEAMSELFVSKFDSFVLQSDK